MLEGEMELQSEGLCAPRPQWGGEMGTEAARLWGVRSSLCRYLGEAGEPHLQGQGWGRPRGGHQDGHRRVSVGATVGLRRGGRGLGQQRAGLRNVWGLQAKGWTWGHTTQRGVEAGGPEGRAGVTQAQAPARSPIPAAPPDSLCMGPKHSLASAHLLSPALLIGSEAGGSCPGNTM